MGYQTLLDAVRALPLEDQKRLILQLQDDLNSEGIDDDLTPEQMAELDRRLIDIQANPDDGIPWEQVLAEARARHTR